MSVFKRKLSDGTHTKKYYCQFKAGKKVYQKCTHQTTLAAAQSWERKYKAKIKGEASAQELLQEAAKVMAEGSITLEHAFDAFLKKPRSQSMGSTRLSVAKKRWNDFVVWMQANYPNIKTLAEVGDTMAEEYISHLRSGALAPYTINDAHFLLQRIWRHLAKDADCPSNPWSPIQKLRNQHEHREAFTREELEKIGNVTRGTWMYDLFLTGICTGLRKGDICTLLWAEVDLDRGVITRRPLKTRSSTNGTVRIPILPALDQHLRTLQRDDVYVFPDLAERYSTGSKQTMMSRDISRMLHSCGITNRTDVPGRARKVSTKDIHSLRHTFCYLASLNRIPFPVVQSIVGHMSPEMTKIYMDHADDEARQLLKAMPVYLAGETPKALPAPRDAEALLAKIKGELQGMTKGNWHRVRDMMVEMIEPESTPPVA